VARLLSSRNSFEGLHAKAINICCTDIPNWKECQVTLRKLRLEWGNIKTKV
jgi:hypothetical protein